MAQVLQDTDLKGVDPLGSLHSCLETYAFKVLPAHAQRANLHFDCFKALSTEKGAIDKKVRATGMFSWQTEKKARRRTRPQRSSGKQPKGNQPDLETLVSGMAGKLEAIFVAEAD